MKSTKRVTVRPATWELYLGRQLVAWVEKVYSGPRGWVLTVANNYAEQRFRSRGDALRAGRRQVLAAERTFVRTGK